MIEIQSDVYLIPFHALLGTAYSCFFGVEPGGYIRGLSAQAQLLLLIGAHKAGGLFYAYYYRPELRRADQERLDLRVSLLMGPGVLLASAWTALDSTAIAMIRGVFLAPEHRVYRYYLQCMFSRTEQYIGSAIVRNIFMLENSEDQQQSFDRARENAFSDIIRGASYLRATALYIAPSAVEACDLDLIRDLIRDWRF